MNNNEVSTNNAVRQFFRFIPDEKQLAIEEFYQNCLERNYIEYKNIEDVFININNNYIGDNLDALRIYSGYNFKNINNALRNRWNYEENGHIKQKEEYEKIAIEIEEIIRNSASSIGNVKVFRGVTLDYFKDYNINCLNDLLKLKGQFLIDKGFTSTSLIENRCFYKKKNTLGQNYNIKIEYLIPEEFEDGIFIGNLAYNKDQCEYIVNTYNLAKVIDVIVNENDAIIKALYIPKKIYDDYYSHNNGSVK